MNIRGSIPELVLVAIMAVASFVVVIRLWQDAIIAVSIELLILCLGWFLLQITLRLRKLEEQSAARDRMMKSNLEELAQRMIQKQNTTSDTVIQAVESIKSRMYR